MVVEFIDTCTLIDLLAIGHVAVPIIFIYVHLKFLCRLLITYHFVVEIPICYPGQISFDRPMATYNDEGHYITGYPTVCYDGSLAPICDTTDLDALDISSICGRAAGVLGRNITIQSFVIIIVSLGGFIGAPYDGYSIPAFNGSANVAVSNLTCSTDYVCTNETVPIDSCDYVYVSCVRRKSFKE